DLRVRAAGLLAVTAVVTVLAATGVLPRWSGLIHLVALPPLDLIADLRVLAAAAPGYPAFLGGLALSLAVRITVLAVLLGGVDRPATTSSCCRSRGAPSRRSSPPGRSGTPDFSGQGWPSPSSPLCSPPPPPGAPPASVSAPSAPTCSSWPRSAPWPT